jgi:hypothetical protein
MIPLPRARAPPSHQEVRLARLSRPSLGPDKPGKPSPSGS